MPTILADGTLLLNVSVVRWLLLFGVRFKSGGGGVSFRFRLRVRPPLFESFGRLAHGFTSAVLTRWISSDITATFAAVLQKICGRVTRAVQRCANNLRCLFPFWIYLYARRSVSATTGSAADGTKQSFTCPCWDWPNVKRCLCVCLRSEGSRLCVFICLHKSVFIRLPRCLCTCFCMSVLYVCILVGSDLWVGVHWRHLSARCNSEMGSAADELLSEFSQCGSLTHTASIRCERPPVRPVGTSRGRDSHALTCGGSSRAIDD